MFKNLNEHDDNDLKKQIHEKRTDIYKENQNETKMEESITEIKYSQMGSADLYQHKE